MNAALPSPPHPFHPSRSAIRNFRNVLAFTSSEVLIDSELTSLLGEDDRSDSTRRVDIYLIQESNDISFNTYSAVSGCRSSKATFFKRAHALGLICGASLKSDFGLSSRRESSGELHLDRCPITFFAIPQINERAGTLSDVLVLVNVCPRFSVTGSGKIRYVGLKRGVDDRASIDELRWGSGKEVCVP